MNGITKIQGQTENDFIIFIWDKLKITAKDLAGILTTKDLFEIRRLQLDEKEKKFEDLKPVGFEHACYKAKKFWEELADDENVDWMWKLQNMLVYDKDGTIRFPDLNETFCADLTWWTTMNWDKGMDLVDSKWYDLLSTWNSVAPAVGNTDLYRLSEFFVKVLGEDGLKCFVTMLGLKDGEYWTKTEFESDWKKIKDTICTLQVYGDKIERGVSDKNIPHLICGFKKKNSI